MDTKNKKPFVKNIIADDENPLNRLGEVVDVRKLEEIEIKKKKAELAGASGLLPLTEEEFEKIASQPDQPPLEEASNKAVLAEKEVGENNTSIKDETLIIREKSSILMEKLKKKFSLESVKIVEEVSGINFTFKGLSKAEVEWGTEMVSRWAYSETGFNLGLEDVVAASSIWEIDGMPTHELFDVKKREDDSDLSLHITTADKVLVFLREQSNSKLIDILYNIYQNKIEPKLKISGVLEYICTKHDITYVMYEKKPGNYFCKLCGEPLLST